MHFTKMHGLGNDYLYVYGEPKNPEKLSIRLSERHFGAGSDGMIWISHSDIADFKMRIFNADGSEAKMCGNGIRCVGKYVYDKGYTDKNHLTIETLSGIKTLDLKTENGKVISVSVDMGNAEISEDITIAVGNEKITGTPVSMGNPHFVIFVSDVESISLEKIGSAIEHHEAFPDGVNVEFVQVIDKSTVRMRVWERGSGITMACGTGACASASAAVSKNHCNYNDDISVILDGGILKINVASDYKIIMTGPAETIYEGEVEV